MPTWDIAVENSAYIKIKKDTKLINSISKHGIILADMGDFNKAKTKMKKLDQELKNLKILNNLKCPCCNQKVRVTLKRLYIKTHKAGDEQCAYHLFILISNTPYLAPILFADAIRDIAIKLNIENFYFAERTKNIKEYTPYNINELAFKLSGRSFKNLIGIDKETDFIYLVSRNDLISNSSLAIIL